MNLSEPSCNASRRARLAWPHMPNTYSMPAPSRQRTTACPPVIRTIAAPFYWARSQGTSAAWGLWGVGVPWIIGGERQAHWVSLDARLIDGCMKFNRLACLPAGHRHWRTGTQCIHPRLDLRPMTLVEIRNDVCNVVQV